MDEIVIDTIYKNVKHLLSAEGHIAKVTKDSRKLIADNLVVLNITPEEHSRAMMIIKDYHKEKSKVNPVESVKEIENTKKNRVNVKRIKNNGSIKKRVSKRK